MIARQRHSILVRSEICTLLRLSIPIILAQLAQSSMAFVDTVMAGQVGATDLAAVALGSSIWFPLSLFQLGLLSALTPIVAQAHGGNNPATIRHTTPQGIYLGLISGVVIMLLLQHADIILPLLHTQAELIPLVHAYLHGTAWGFPAVGICFALRYCSEGLSLTRPGMIVSFSGLATNIIANYTLVFGKFGFPALGGPGCGVATAVTMWMMMLVMVIFYWKGSVYRKLRLLHYAHLSAATQKQLLKLGLPIGAGLFIECSIFALIALLLSRFGAQTVAAHQIALSFTSMTFMIPLSISSAIAVRVGHTIGRRRPSQTRRAVRVGIATTFTLALVSCATMALFPHRCVAIFSHDPQLRNAAASLLTLAAIFQVPDAMQVSCAGALRGCKDTRIPMLIQTIAYWGIGLPCGCYLGLYLNWGARGFWIGLICGLSAAAIMLLLRLRRVLAHIARS